jgi:hypothetical protein
MYPKGPQAWGIFFCRNPENMTRNDQGVWKKKEMFAALNAFMLLSNLMLLLH